MIKSNSYTKKRNSLRGVITVLALLLAVTLLTGCTYPFLISSSPKGEYTVNTASNINVYQLSVSTGDELTPADVVEQLLPSVVFISNYTGGQVYSTGSGFLVDAENGYIITNAHVIENQQAITVTFHDGNTFNAAIVGSDVFTDLAVIKVENAALEHNYPEVRLAYTQSETPARMGDFVIAIGFPGGLAGSASATFGYISALERELPTTSGYSVSTLQTDAAINPGNSGGPLINAYGYVIGINSAKIVAEGYEGMGFSITTDQAVPIISDLIDLGYVAGRVRLGIEYDKTKFVYRIKRADVYGVMVTSVNYAYAPAALKTGDIIVAYGNSRDSLTTITHYSQLTGFIKDSSVGDSVALRVMRPLYYGIDYEEVIIEGTFKEFVGD